MWGAALGAAGGAVIGEAMAQGRHVDAERARRRAVLELLALNPEVKRSAFETEDPRARQAQIAALAQLEQAYRAGGLDPESQAALREAQAQTSAAERGSREALAQNAASRGMSGSGASFAAQLANQQGSANRGAIVGAKTAADARTRALQAMTGASAVASNVRGQDYDRSSSLDAIQRFNAGQRTTKAQALSNAYTGNANQLQAQANYDTERYRAMGAGAGKAIGSAIDSRREDDDEEGGW